MILQSNIYLNPPRHKFGIKILEQQSTKNLTIIMYCYLLIYFVIIRYDHTSQFDFEVNVSLDMRLYDCPSDVFQNVKRIAQLTQFLQKKVETCVEERQELFSYYCAPVRSTATQVN